MTISTCLIVKNSEATLERCLESVQSFSDEIVIIIDSLSKDSSEKIAHKFTQKIYINKFISFAQQRNFAISKTSSDYILSIDADEEVDSKLASSIQNLKKTSNTSLVYSLKRKNYMFGQVINHGNWDPNPIPRLWKKTATKWIGDVHEKLDYSGNISPLSGSLLHHSYTSIEEFINKSNYYTNFETKTRSPIKEFFRRYVWHAGFLDGKAGLFLAYCMVIYSYMANVKVWEKSHT